MDAKYGCQFEVHLTRVQQLAKHSQSTKYVFTTTTYALNSILKLLFYKSREALQRSSAHAHMHSTYGTASTA